MNAINAMSKAFGLFYLVHSSNQQIQINTPDTDTNNFH